MILNDSSYLFPRWSWDPEFWPFSAGWCYICSFLSLCFCSFLFALVSFYTFTVRFAVFTVRVHFLRTSPVYKALARLNHCRFRSRKQDWTARVLGCCFRKGALNAGFGPARPVRLGPAQKTQNGAGFYKGPLTCVFFPSLFIFVPQTRCVQKRIFSSGRLNVRQK